MSSFFASPDPSTIQATDTPEWSYLFGGWSPDDFIAWHKALVISEGLNRANTDFIDAWNQAPNLCGQISYRTTFGIQGSRNADFIQYAKDNGFYDALFSGIIGSVVQASNAGADVVHKIADDLEAFGKYFNWFLLIAVIAFLWIYFPQIRKVLK